MDTLLYLNGTTANISTETSDSLMYFNSEKGVYMLELDDKTFEWHANMWMQI